MVRVKQKAKKFGFRSSPDVDFEAGLEAKARETRGESSIQQAPQNLQQQVANLPPGASAATIPGVTTAEDADREVINLTAVEKPLTGIAEFRERDTLLGKIAKVITSPVTTAVLAATLATLVTAGAGAPTAATAVKTASQVGKLAPITRTSSGLIVRAAPTNAKTIAQTTSWISKLGKVVRSPGFVAPVLVASIGTYPFAGFIKEEALQTLGFAVRTAEANDDVEGMQKALDEQLELLNPTLWDKIIGAVPFANVVKQLKDFYESATTKLEVDAKRFEDLKKEIENPPETFEESSKRLAKERREQELSEREEDTEFFEDIATKNRERKLEERAEDTAFFEGLKEDRESGSSGTFEQRSSLGFGLLKSSGEFVEDEEEEEKKKKKKK